MIQWIVASSVLIVVVAALRFLLRGKLSLRLQYALWLLVLIRLLIPVSFGSSEVSVMNAVERSTISIAAPLYLWYTGDMGDVAPEPAPDGSADSVEKSEPSVHIAPYAGDVAVNTTGVRLTTVLQVAWFSGAVLLAFALLASNIRFAARLRRSRRMLNISGCALPVYISPEVDTPCLFGLLRPCVYVTPAVAENTTVLRHSIEHETTHFRHADHVWAALRGVCLVLHWYNPLVWLAAALSRRDGELACDEATVKRLGEGQRTEYGRTLISLTCHKRPALLLTATTMTGSKNSIKERIIMIAKKPRMAIYTLIAVVLIAAVAAGCTFTGAASAKDKPWTWMKNLSAADITSATAWYGGSEATPRLSDDDISELVFILNSLEKDDFTENKQAAGSTPAYGLAFECGGESYFVNQADAPFGSLEMRYEGKQWWINSQELHSFILALSDGDEQALSVQVEADGSFPQSVIDYAVDYTQSQLLYYTDDLGYAITEAKIIGLTGINTGTAGLDNGINMYRLEYRFLAADPDEIMLVGGMQLDGDYITEWGSTGQPYLLLHWDNSGDETVWQRICISNYLTMQEEYGTPEMLEQYGDMYTAAAMELYAQYSSGNVEALIINALNSDGAYAEAAEDALIDSLMDDPVATLEAIGAREAGVADWLCWSLAYYVRDMALDTGDALSGEGLSESGLYARDQILGYFVSDTPAPRHWRMVYLDFFDNELSALSPDEIVVLGLFDTQADGVPELAVWYENSDDGALYYTDGIQVYQNADSIYPGAPPQQDVLSALDGESIEREAMNAFLNGWRP